VAGRPSGELHTTQASIDGETGLNIQSAHRLIQPRVGHEWQSGMSDSTTVGFNLFALNSSSAGSTDVSSRLGLRFSMPTTTFFGKPTRSVKEALRGFPGSEKAPAGALFFVKRNLDLPWFAIE